MANNELSNAIDAARTMEALEKEAGLRFGPRVTISYDPEFPADSIIAPAEANYRFASGQMVAGFKLESDLRNLAGMADDIEALRGITTPLTVSIRADNSAHLLQGFRRFGGAAIVRERAPGSPLANKLLNLPCVIYKGLTLEQERQLTNDQTAKKFSKAEVLRIFYENIDGGFNWLNVCERMYQQIGEVTQNGENVRRIEAMTDPAKRKEELKSWLLSIAYQGWFNGLKAGKVCRDLWMQTYLWQDGFKGVTRPRVVMDSARMKKIWTEVLADQNAGEFNATEGTGPRMDKKLSEYAEADAKAYNPDGTKKKAVSDPTAEKLKSLKDVQELIKQEETNGVGSLLSAIYRITLKDGGNPEATRLIRNFDRCRMAFNTHRAYLKPEVISVLALVLDGVDGSHERFTEFLTSNYNNPAEAPTLTETVQEVREVSGVPENATVPTEVSEVVQEVAVTVPADVLPVTVQKVVPVNPDDQPATEMPTMVDGPTEADDKNTAHQKGKDAKKKHAKK